MLAPVGGTIFVEPEVIDHLEAVIVTALPAQHPHDAWCEQSSPLLVILPIEVSHAARQGDPVGIQVLFKWLFGMPIEVIRRRVDIEHEPYLFESGAWIHGVSWRVMRQQNIYLCVIAHVIEALYFILLGVFGLFLVGFPDRNADTSDAHQADAGGSCFHGIRHAGLEAIDALIGIYWKQRRIGLRFERVEPGVIFVVPTHKDQRAGRCAQRPFNRWPARGEVIEEAQLCGVRLRMANRRAVEPFARWIGAQVARLQDHVNSLLRLLLPAGAEEKAE